MNNEMIKSLITPLQSPWEFGPAYQTPLIIKKKFSLTMTLFVYVQYVFVIVVETRVLITILGSFSRLPQHVFKLFDSSRILVDDLFYIDL